MTMMSGTPTIGSLCTGYGGLDMGFLAAVGGGAIQWVAENDRKLETLLRRRFPGVPNLVRQPHLSC